MSLGEKAKATGILSGTGTEGAMDISIKHIAVNGGNVLTQDPEAAQFGGMSCAAVVTAERVRRMLSVEKWGWQKSVDICPISILQLRNNAFNKCIISL